MFLYCWWDGEGKLGMVQKNNTRGIFKGIKLFKTIFFIICSLRVLYCVQQLGHFFPFLCEGFQPIPRIRFDLGVLCPDWTLSTGVNGWWFSFWCGLCGSSQANALTHSFIHILLFCSVLFPFLGFCLFNIFSDFFPLELGVQFFILSDSQICWTGYTIPRIFTILFCGVKLNLQNFYIIVSLFLTSP